MLKIKLPKLSHTLILSLAILLAVILRFYKLAEFPVQLNHDEVTQLYDAISIAQTGKDIYGNFLPAVFESVHDFKPPFYTYITAIAYFILGAGEATIRVPAAFFGVLIVPAAFFFTLKLFKSLNVAFLAAFITVISPFEIFFSRKSFENGAGIFFMLTGFTLLLHFIQKKSSKAWLYLGGVILVLGMYTYFSQAVIIPLLLIAFAVIFRNDFLAALRVTMKSRKEYFFIIFAFLILLAPLAAIVISNPGSRYRSQTVFITQDINLGRIMAYSKTETPIFSELFRVKAIGDFAFDRYLRQFNPTYLFGNGLELTNQGPLGSGPLLSVQLFFILVGIYRMVVMQGLLNEKKFIAAWILIGVVPSGITFEPFSPHRSMMVFTVLNIVAALGVYQIVRFFQKSKALPTFAKSVAVAGVAGLFTFQLINFLYVYFVNYPFEKSQNMQYPFEAVSEYAWSEYDKFDQIIFDPVFGQAAPVVGTGAHYYLAYFGGYPPAKMQEEYRSGEKEREMIFDKFSIRKIEWKDDRFLKNTMLILSPWSIDPKILDQNKDKIIHTFYFYDRQPAFYVMKPE